MSTAAEIVRVLRASGGKLDGRAIHQRGAFHDLQTTLQTLQQHSKPGGFIEREKPGNSGTFVYGLRSGAKLPIDIEDELRDDVSEQSGSSLEASKPPQPSSTKPVTAVAPALNGQRSAAKLHEHLFKTLEDLESGKIDHVQAKARAAVADQIIKLANVQLLYAQLKATKQIGDITDMPLIENKAT